MVDAGVHSPRLPGSVRPPLARRRAGEYFDPFIDRSHGPDVKPPLADRINHFFSQHQIFYARRRHDDSLLAAQSPGFADFEEAFDLLVHSADRLNLTQLIDRPGDGQVLPKRQPGETREQRIKLGDRRAVAFYLVIGLLEGDPRRERQGLVLGVASREKAGEYQKTLVVKPPAQPRLPLNIDDAFGPQGSLRSDAYGPSEFIVADVQHRQTIHLSFSRAGRVDEDRPFGDQLANLLLDQVRAVDSLTHSSGHVPCAHVSLPVYRRPVARFGHEIADLSRTG